jgi:hypothetical protein
MLNWRSALEQRGFLPDGWAWAWAMSTVIFQAVGEVPEDFPTGVLSGHRDYAV